MRTKAYFVVPVSDAEVVSAACQGARVEWHGHLIPPANTSMLLAIIDPPAALETGFGEKYLAFPDLHDNSETISQKHIDQFPASCGLTTNDTAYLAMKKVSTALGMAALHPKG